VSNLTTPASVQKLQTALHDKAKESPSFRFHALYDKVYRKDVLAFAYACCKANGGAAGVDKQTFEDIETYGVERWLDELAQELKSRTYQPLPVRRVYTEAGRETAAARSARYPGPYPGSHPRGQELPGRSLIVI
jgi:RNA-directed DNA polymerase